MGRTRQVRRMHRGDCGQTDLPALGRVGKNHPLIEACGSLDELICAIGEAAARVRIASLEAAKRSSLQKIARIQRELLLVGSLVSCGPKRANIPAARARAMVRRLENEIQAMQAQLPAMRGFVLPGGDLAAVAAHFARAICRRAERDCVSAVGGERQAAMILPYLNRLSGWLFALARYLLKLTGREEECWKPRKSRRSRSLR